MRIFLFLLGTMVMVLGACTPALETTSYRLPPTAGGRMCTHQCVEGQDYCHQDCSLHHRQCVMKIQTQALKDYDLYTQQQFRNHEAIDLNPSDFERQSDCVDDRDSCTARCDRTYRSCFGDCGGEVTVTSSCQFLCF